VLSGTAVTRQARCQRNAMDKTQLDQECSSRSMHLRRIAWMHGHYLDEGKRTQLLPTCKVCACMHGQGPGLIPAADQGEDSGLTGVEPRRQWVPCRPKRAGGGSLAGCRAGMLETGPQRSPQLMGCDAMHVCQLRCSGRANNCGDPQSFINPKRVIVWIGNPPPFQVQPRYTPSTALHPPYLYFS
jgi:hypothetical protein